MSHPTLNNIDISRMLGQEWRNKSPEEKRPYVEQEEILRAQYKDQMMKYRASLLLSQEASSTTTSTSPLENPHSQHIEE